MEILAKESLVGARTAPTATVRRVRFIKQGLFFLRQAQKVKSADLGLGVENKLGSFWLRSRGVSQPELSQSSGIALCTVAHDDEYNMMSQHARVHD